MCGIFGEYLFCGEIEIDRCVNKLNLLERRGPDGFGFEFGNYKEGKYQLYHNQDMLKNSKDLNPQFNYFSGHRRLSILDLSENAFQPMETSDKRYSIIFNGEIYNYIELKKELTALGVRFHTDHSDTEVLLNAYSEWGTDCLCRIRGMFAFAIFDRVNQTVFLARDRIGQKPLYYEFSDEKFSFSSELNPLIQFSNSKRKIDLEGLRYYMAFGYIPHPISIFEGIKKLPPASYALVDLKEKLIQIERYWDVSFSEGNETETFEDYKEDVEKLITESAALRLRSDVPVGAFISGGIDSTLVVKKIKEIGKKKFDIFGADFPQEDKSEKKYMEKVASRYEQNLNVSYIDLSHVENIENVVKVFDEPFDGGSSIALFDLFKVASKTYKVILTGDGGDEMFSGYTYYSSLPQRHKKFKYLKILFFPEILLSLLWVLRIRNRKIRKLLQLIQGDILTAGLIFSTESDLLELMKNENPPSLEIGFFEEIRSKIKKLKLQPATALQYFDVNTILPGRMLYKLDRFSMYYSVEARSPLLDHLLAEKAFSIPQEMKERDGKTKSLLKRILEDDFDKGFVHRKKQGFGNPLSHWFKNSKRGDIFKILLDEKSLIYHFLDYKRLHACFPQIKGGFDGTREKTLWRLIVLGQYLENYKSYIEH